MENEHNREEAIFKIARKLASNEERTAYVSKACGDDKELLSRIETLLKAYDDISSNDFLEDSPYGSEVTLIDQVFQESPGTTIGPYRLLEKLGEGGMAVVYKAEQEQPIQRKVALKILKPGMDSSKGCSHQC